MSLELSRRNFQFVLKIFCMILLLTHPLSAAEIIASEGIEDSVFDDRTLLDVFGEVAKQYLTQDVIPPTDAECMWDWRYVRCEPWCSCQFKPQIGDYHLGRSCRLQSKPDCDPMTSIPHSNQLQLVIQRLVQGSQKVLQAIAIRVKIGYSKIQKNVCDELPELECSDDGLPVLAWQERLLCRHKIPDCTP